MTSDAPMGNLLSRTLLGFSGLILLTGGLLHAGAFGKAVAATGASDLPAFYANSLKALWLIDSATLMTLSVVLGCLAARPALADRSVIVLVAIIPAATAALLYKFIGNFLPAHMLLVAAAAAVVGALRLPR
jgi:hypothetical protein